jgi:hypothetical protein
MSDTEGVPPTASSDALPSPSSSERPDHATGTATAGSAVTTEEESSRLRTWRGILTSRINRMILILTYPFVVIFTVASLLLVITFCVFPTLLCMTLGVCIYYCMMDDPIPLSVLLRYMLSPDPDENHYPHPNPYSQSRGSIQAKLIIRKLLRIEDFEENEDADNGKATKESKKEEEPRRHPFPIEFKTSRKCLHFSEPIIYDEKEDETQADKDTETRIPLYQRLDPSTQPQAGHTTSSADEENALSNLSAALAVPPDDNELGLVEIAIGTADSEESNTGGCHPEPSGTSQEDSPVHEAQSQSDRNTNQLSRKNEDDQQSVTKPPAKSDSSPVVAATEQLEEVMELVEDYFGITNARERGTTCDICLLDFEVDEEVAWSPNTECVHSFHKDCVLDWLIRKPSCPSCRSNYLESKDGGDENV